MQTQQSQDSELCDGEAMEPHDTLQESTQVSSLSDSEQNMYDLAFAAEDAATHTTNSQIADQSQVVTQMDTEKKTPAPGPYRPRGRSKGSRGGSGTNLSNVGHGPYGGPTSTRVDDHQVTQPAQTNNQPMPNQTGMAFSPPT